MLEWYIYEITTEQSLITGMMVRGRVRKFCLQNEIDIIIENASDNENCVRFGLLDSSKLELVTGFSESIIPDAKISLVEEKIHNPVLSKLKVNIEERYTI